MEFSSYSKANIIKTWLLAFWFFIFVIGIDASSAYLTKNPEGLASTFQKITRDRNPMKTADQVTSHFYIANPF